MEEYITRSEFERQIAQLREEMKHQQTDEIPAVNVNVASQDVLTRLDELKIDAKAYTSDAAIFKNKVEHVETDVSTLKDDVSTLKNDMEQVKTDIGTIKTVQSGHSKFFEEHGKRLSAMNDDISEIKGLLQQLLKQQKP